MASDPSVTRDRTSIDLSRAVIESVSKAEGVDPMDLDRRLAEVIDPDALNAVFAGRDGDAGSVVFRYHGYVITVERDGRVTLERSDEP